MLFIPFIITGIAIYKCLRGLLSFLKLRFYWALSAFLRCCSSCFPIRNTGNCFFGKVETKLSLDELYGVIQKLGAREKWSYEHAGDDCFVGHTSPGFFSGSWGEQIFVVFDKGQVWITVSAI